MRGPLETAAGASAASIHLIFALSCLSLVALILGASYAYKTIRQETHFVSSCASGPVAANEVSEAFVFEWVARAIYERYTWSVEDIAVAQKTFLVRLHPAVLEPYKTRVMDEEQKAAREAAMTSGVVLVRSWVVDRRGLNTHVRAQTVRHLWIKGVADAREMLVNIILVPLLESGWPKDIRVLGWDDDVPLGTKGLRHGR